MNTALVPILLVVVAASAIFATIEAPVASADGVISDLLPFELPRGFVGIGVDAVNTLRVFPGTFALFRVLKSDVYAGHQHFSNGFDSRQPHFSDT